MNKNFWLLIIVAVIAYFVGVKFPATGENLLAKAGV